MAPSRTSLSSAPRYSFQIGRSAEEKNGGAKMEGPSAPGTPLPAPPTQFLPAAPPALVASPTSSPPKTSKGAAIAQEELADLYQIIEWQYGPLEAKKGTV